MHLLKQAATNYPMANQTRVSRLESGHVRDIAPVHQLPPEILSVIFTDLHERRSRYRIPSEVTVSHVCNLWREIALNNPFLWTEISIYSSKSLDRVSHYLERSQTCSIDIRFDIWHLDRCLEPVESAESILRITELVINHTDRWRTLFVFASHRHTTTSILSQMASLSAPSLERIRVVDDGVVILNEEGTLDPVTFSRPTIFTGGTPKLVSVHTDTPHFSPSLAGVTTLHIRSSTSHSSFEMNASVLSDLAVACPSLTTLSIHGTFISGPWPTDNIKMPSIRQLWFSKGHALAAKFLATVSLPKLESLWLDCRDDEMIQALSSLPQPALPALKYLTLQSFDFYASSTFAVIFSNVENIHLMYCSSFHVSFLKETLVERECSHWPRLDTLVFRTTRETHAKKFSKVIDDMVCERADGGRPIRRVLVDKDILADLYTKDSVMNNTDLDVLSQDNFDDPWWQISHSSQ